MDEEMEMSEDLDEVDLSDVKLCSECETEFSGEGDKCEACEREELMEHEDE